MKLSDLQQLQTEYEQRGYRVAFETFHSTDRATGEEQWFPDELTTEEEVGWPTPEEAEQHATLLRKVGGASYRNIRVIGPDGSEWTPVLSETAAPTPNATTSAPAKPSVREVLISAGLPAGSAILTILAGTGTLTLVGDDRGLVYAVPSPWLADRTQAGQPIRPKPHWTRGEGPIGSQGLRVPFALAAQDGLQAWVAFADGGWFVKVADEAPV